MRLPSWGAVNHQDQCRCGRSRDHHGPGGDEACNGLRELIFELGGEAFRRSFSDTAANFPVLDAMDLHRAWERRLTIQREWMVFLERYPAILTPTSSQPTFPVDHDLAGREALAVISRAFSPSSAIAGLALPAISVRAGSAAGAPAGVQIVSGRFMEERCLTCGRCHGRTDRKIASNRAQKQVDLSERRSNMVSMNKRVTRKSFVRPHSDGRREQIIDAALKVMIAEGVFHTTTRKIAEAAGVNVATLHYHFNDKEEILFKVMEVLVANYRATLAKQFSSPQRLHDRIADLLRFIWSEIEKAPGEQLTLQEMTLYMLRHRHGERMASEKDREFLSLYAESLRTAIDVVPEDAGRINELANLIYTSFVGILNQWLAVRDTTLLIKTMNNLIEAAQQMASRTSNPCASSL